MWGYALYIHILVRGGGTYSENGRSEGQSGKVEGEGEGSVEVHDNLVDSRSFKIR